jgi:hypothetical protein
MSAEWLHRFDESTARFAKLNHTGLQVVQRSFNKIILLLVMSQEIVPKWMLNKGRSVLTMITRVTKNVPCSRL